MARLLAFALLPLLSSAQLQASLDDHGAFQVSVKGAVWLEGVPLRAFVNGSWRSAGHGLTPLGARRYDGSDALGKFSCVNVSWRVEGPGMLLHSSLSVYEDGATVVFTQELPEGAEGTDASHPKLPALTATDPGLAGPSVAFPAFKGTGGMLANLGFVTWYGLFVNLRKGMDVVGMLEGLSSNGPVVLFDGNYTSLVVSPMDNFKNAVHSGVEGNWEAGVSSEVKRLPKGFRHRTLLKLGEGITAGMDEWGQTLRKAHGTKRLDGEDLNVNYLSYWTDNGAYYYGDRWNQAGGGGDVVNETAMLAVAKGLEEKGLLDAVKIWQLDDWWYPGSKKVYVVCVKNWTLTTPAFESDLAELSRKVRTPWLLYVPFFCPENAYDKEFKFVQSVPGPRSFAEPHPDHSLAFYRKLFDYGIANGMRGYENDFLNFNFLAMPHFRENLGESERWLGGMDLAAVERKVPVQMCMALPSDLMASVDLNSFTNYRASEDYAGGGNFNIGASSLLGFALGLRPSKDNFWTHRPESSRQDGRPWGPHENPGSHCELNAIIATLSTGPVGIADKAGDTNETIVLRSVRPDGLIVQPSRPATAVDASFGQDRLGPLQRRRPPSPGKVWGTHSAIARGAAGEPANWHYFLAMNIKTAWRLAASDFYPKATAASGWVARRWHHGDAQTACKAGVLAYASGCVQSLAIRADESMPALLNDRPLAAVNDSIAYDLWQLAPIESNGWVLLGDVSRYTSVSPKRFERVAAGSDGILATVSGAPGEELEIFALAPRTEGDWQIVSRRVSFTKQAVSATVSFERSGASLYA